MTNRDLLLGRGSGKPVLRALCATLVLAAVALPAGELVVPPLSSYAPLPEAISSFGAVAQDGWLYVYGGHKGERHEYSSNEVSAACRRLNLADGITWETLASDVPAQSPGLAAHEGFLYRVGGMAARNPKGQKHDLYSHASAARLDLRALTWERLPSLPEARSSHDAAIVGNKLYVAGGWQLAGKDAKPKWHDTALALDLTRPDAKWETFPQPFKRRGLCLATLGAKLYCLGGMTDGDSTSLAVDVLDSGTGAWTKGPDLPSGRMKGFGASACVVGGRLYVSGMSGAVWRLAEDEGRWEQCAQLRLPRFFHRLLPGGAGQLLAVGGEGSDGKLHDIEAIPLAAGPAQDWPQFRGPNRDGISTESGWSADWPVEGPRVAWRKALGKGLSSFAVSAGRVFTLGNANETDTLWCLAVATGRELWRHDYPCASTNHPMSIVLSGPAATPAVAAGKVYSLSREGDLFCLEAASGKLVWKAHLLRDLGGKRPVYGYAGSPLVSGGLVFLDVGGPNGSTVALNAATGTVRWRSGDGEAGYSSPRLTSLAGQAAVALFKGDAFALLAPNTGAVLARFETTARDFCNTITPALAGPFAFVSNTGKDGSACLDLAGGAGPRVAWRKPELGLLFNSPVLWRGRLYAFNDAQRNENELHCLDARTGETCWTFNGIEKGVFTVADGKMILLTRQSELVLLSLDEPGPKVLARAQVLGGKSWAEPVLAGGRIFCRNNDGQSACLDVSIAKPQSATSRVEQPGLASIIRKSPL